MMGELCALSTRDKGFKAELKKYLLACTRVRRLGHC
jgi:hypothetical protein